LKFHVSNRRKNLKKKAVIYKGGSCSQCGYHRCLEALTFHHIDRVKEFGIAAKGYTRSWEKVKVELDQCILVCAVCHIEIEAGVRKIAASTWKG